MMTDKDILLNLSRKLEKLIALNRNLRSWTWNPMDVKDILEVLNRSLTKIENLETSIK